MKKITVVLFALVLVVSVSAQESGIGVGLSTDGLAGKYWMGENALSIHFGGGISVDYLLHDNEMVNIAEGPTPVYYGAGLGMSITEVTDTNGDTDNELNLGIRGVLGISYYFSSFPVDIYTELTPSVGVLGGGGVDLINFELGARYFF